MRSATAPFCCRLFAWILLGALPLCASPHRRIPAEEHGDKVYASSQGRCMGNIYGLAHEQKYFHEPGPDRFPLGYGSWGAARMTELNGAFSDDDTDIEFMYLLAMERYGVEPTYEQLAGFWRRRVARDVWLGNRAALGAMHYGLAPPWTGTSRANPHWFQIDPQRVNEIWAVTVPGMVHFAEYLFQFDAVETNAIRIAGEVGAAGGYVKDPPRFTSITELSVYGPPETRSAATRADGTRRFE